jgi:hypothetical protein
MNHIKLEMSKIEEEEDNRGVEGRENNNCNNDY